MFVFAVLILNIPYMLGLLIKLDSVFCIDFMGGTICRSSVIFTLVYLWPLLYFPYSIKMLLHCVDTIKERKLALIVISLYGLITVIVMLINVIIIVISMFLHQGVLLLLVPALFIFLTIYYTILTRSIMKEFQKLYNELGLG
ncbi:MAG: hypothetical protein MK137_09040 [Rickettsiales bacterium]|nr:hypothetical protein [Rickettsiales bacterium]